MAISTNSPSVLPEPDIAAFIDVVEQVTALSDYPHASVVDHGAVVYDADRLADTLEHGSRQLEAEIADALSVGPGIVVIRGALPASTVDPVTEIFFEVIAEQRLSNTAAGDHFGKPGANDRIWNALEKLAMVDPDAFVAYYANDFIALCTRAWLGPMYQITSQVNVVNPGGAAQMPHRDYHLGFMTHDVASQFPAHAHRLSAALSLQGAIAHCDMPVETGPTLYLAHSHKYESGYLAWRRPEFIEYFDRNHTQVPLTKGDLVFFNPALFHAAGTNVTSDVRRMANLLQINSALGRAMESVDRARMSVALYPALRRARSAGMIDRHLTNAVAACAEGYAFPTNLDRDQPVGRLTPESQAELVHNALQNDVTPAELERVLSALTLRQRSA